MLYVNDTIFRIFEMIEERGLQFVLPEIWWKPLYRDYLKQKKINKLIAQIEGLVQEHPMEPCDDE